MIALLYILVFLIVILTAFLWGGFHHYISISRAIQKARKEEEERIMKRSK